MSIVGLRIPSDEDRHDYALSQFFAPAGRKGVEDDGRLDEFAPYALRDVCEMAPSSPERVLIGAVALRCLRGEEMLRSDDEVALYRRVHRHLGWQWHFRTHIGAHMLAYGKVAQPRVDWFRVAAAVQFLLMRSALVVWWSGSKPPSTPFMVAEFTDAIDLLSFRDEFSSAFGAAEIFVKARYERPEDEVTRRIREIGDRMWRAEHA